VQTRPAFIPFVRFEDDGEQVLIGTGHFDAEGQVHSRCGARSPSTSSGIPTRTRIISPVGAAPHSRPAAPAGPSHKSSSVRELPR
jgi:hypothetical protein